MAVAYRLCKRVFKLTDFGTCTSFAKLGGTRTAKRLSYNVLDGNSRHDIYLGTYLIYFQHGGTYSRFEAFVTCDI